MLKYENFMTYNSRYKVSVTISQSTVCKTNILNNLLYGLDKHDIGHCSVIDQFKYFSITSSVTTRIARE